ncbi:hypothetical protein ALC57_17815 [Trachymyrmex cornetzi]|uniref:Uncharacterized protein n=1 Tax=Trachymyrmex cornetzi TaxID=471704 RepID=A0A195DB34_9HYME|nr:hypothetical protein ALC57_17815 [Trachymyrmex cornetzi]
MLASYAMFLGLGTLLIPGGIPCFIETMNNLCLPLPVLFAGKTLLALPATFHLFNGIRHLRLRHISRFCEKPEVCLNCAGDYRFSKEAPYQLPKKCINCGDSLSTLERSCTIYKRHQEIAKIMVFDNLPFLEASRLIEKNYGFKEAPSNMSLKTLRR